MFLGHIGVEIQKGKMLQRIYGTAWNSDKELKKYISNLEEASKRDHRKLGQKYDLFHFQEEAPGMVFGIQKAGLFSGY